MYSAARRMNQKPIPGGPEMGERLRLSAQRHHPSREGIAGGANGEVSWLRASRLAFPVSQWREPTSAARYSGGAAPDLHRLP